MTAETDARTGASIDGSDPVLAVEGLKKHFIQGTGILDRLFGSSGRVRAVDGVDLTVNEGEVLAVVGESGCGKSTLAKTIVGLHSPTDGSVRYRGEEIGSLSDRAMRPYRASIQMVFQDPLASLNPRQTVGQILRAPMQVHGIGADAEDRARRVEDALEEVGLEAHHTSRYPHQFSGGQQQRIAIARSLTVDPDLLIADEPVSSLDVSVQAQILSLLERLRRERDIAMVFIAHDLSVVKYVADRVLVMYLGEVAETAPTDDLFASPSHPYTKSLLSAVPRIGVDEGVDDRVILRGTPPSPVSPPDGCRFHTRCPALIPPTNWEGSQAQFLNVFQLRTRLEDGEIDVKAVSDRLRAEGETATTTVSERILTDNVDASLDALPGETRRTLQAAVDAYVEDGPSAAAESLSESGTLRTPCETDVPQETRVGNDHVVACHRVDPDQPGSPGETDL